MDLDFGSRAVPLPPFEPLERLDGYLPIERHGLIGDGAGCALVAADGTVPWLCVPRFDDDPLCAAILDTARGGHVRVAPDDVVEARQWYLEDSAVLVTEQRTATGGVVRLVDAFALQPGADLHVAERHGAGAHVRTVEVLHGDVEIVVELAPRKGRPSGASRAGSRSTGRRHPTSRSERCATDPSTVHERWWRCTKASGCPSPSGGTPTPPVTPTPPTRCSDRWTHRGGTGRAASTTRVCALARSGGRH
jgi:alpha,alpha-trehalase